MLTDFGWLENCVIDRLRVWGKVLLHRASGHGLYNVSES